MKRKFRIATVLMLLIGLLSAAAFTVSAESNKIKLETHTYWAGTPGAYTVFSENLPDSAKLVSIKSSKPGVLKAEKWGSGKWDCVVIPLKKGKSKVTVTYKIKGKKVKVSGVFTVKPYPNAIKKLVYNGKKISLKKNKYEADKISKTTKKVSIKVTPAKGWKLRDPIEILSEGGTYKDLKNGKSVKISPKKPRVAALITLENKKGEEFEYFINITE